MRFPSVKVNRSWVRSNGLPLILTALAVASFFAGWAGLIPAGLVESVFSRAVFPFVSGIMIRLSRVTGGFALIDALIPAAVLLAGFLAYRKRPIAIVGLVSAGYLIFFWSWGINYQREPIEGKLGFRADEVTDAAVNAFAAEAAFEINRAYSALPDSGTAMVESDLVAEADRAVRAAIEAIDGTPASSWTAPPPVRSSGLLNPWFQASRISGMFNPIGHEALVTGGLLDPELPSVVLHELAHVRGYADEGEASLIALVSAAHSDNPVIRYSGWLSLWPYVETRKNVLLLGEGPRADLDAIRERVRSQQVEWVDRTQARTLDAFLRANRVDDGIRSYARIVRLAVGTRHSWGRFGPV